MGVDLKINTEFGIIAKVDEGSPAWKAGIREGDRVTHMSGYPLVDILDYRFLSAERQVSVTFVSPGSSEARTEIVDNEYEEDLGLEFSRSGLEEIRSCKNKCVFCFVDQLPPGVRDTLRVKDDDYVHSFLNGNYVSLTNCTDDDIERIIRLRLTPLYISVHSTEPELRLQMMKNPRSVKIMDQLRKLIDGGISVHAQLVLIPGLNDGEHLDRSLNDLADFYPGLLSVAAVPVGLTGHRKGLAELRPYTRAEALDVIGRIVRFEDSFRRKSGTRFAWAADEFYLKAGMAIPEDDFYEESPQFDNGVGLVRQFLDSFTSELESRLGRIRHREDLSGTPVQRLSVTVVTGVSAAPLIEGAVSRLPRDLFEINVITVINRFFGETVTVAGLMTGGDILKSLEHVVLGHYVIIPDVCLRDRHDTFLDDMTLEEFKASVPVPVVVCEATGEGLVKAIFRGLSGRTKTKNPRLKAVLGLRSHR